MIEDLDGTAAEPARRGHVAVLSGAIAAVSLALFLALIVPPSRDAAAPPAPSPTTQHLTIVSNPLSQTRLDLTLDSVCPDGTRLIPPYHLAFDADGGQIYAVRYVVGGVAHPVPVSVVADKRTPYLTVACGTSDIAPWADR